MATKPGGFFTVATLDDFDAGDRIGDPTKIAFPDVPNGLIPGDPAASEHLNYAFNILGDWSVWLFAGSALAGLDSHIIETDVDGFTKIAAATLGGTASSSTALRVDENSGATSVVVIVSNASGGDGIRATVTGGTGQPIDAKVEGTGTGAAVIARQNNAGASASPAVDALVTGNGPAVLAEAEGTGPAVRAIRKDDGGPAVSCESAGVTAPSRGTLFLEPHATNPFAPLDGDIWKVPGVTGFGRGQLRIRDLDGASGGGGAGSMGVWATPGGQGFEYDEDLGNTTESVAVIKDKVSISLDSASGTPGHPAGDYFIEFYCQVRLDVAADVGTKAIVEFHGPSGIIGNRIDMDFAAVNLWKTVSFGPYKYTLAGGPHQFEIKFRSDTNGEEVVISQARILARGTYG